MRSPIPPPSPISSSLSVLHRLCLSVLYSQTAEAANHDRISFPRIAAPRSAFTSTVFHHSGLVGVTRLSKPTERTARGKRSEAEKHSGCRRRRTRPMAVVAQFSPRHLPNPPPPILVCINERRGKGYPTKSPYLRQHIHTPPSPRRT